jgi:hypothetical protein
MLSAHPRDVRWRISSWSKSDNCVEVGSSEAAVLIRDTKNRSGRVLSFPFTAWEDFIKTIQADNSGLRQDLRS